MKHFGHQTYNQIIRLIVLLILPVGLILLGSEAKAQLTVNTAVTPTNAVQNILMGEGVTASNIIFSPGNQATQIGSFTCNNCGINLSSGVIMGSGNVMGAVGPNNSGSYNLGPPSTSDNVGDPDLQAISGGSSIHNAAVLKFNFIPTGDSIAFRFVFGSEEYPEYVNSVNDVFGFFISGPGISGPYQNNAKNIALIPGTSNPVSINTVNNLTNSLYYVANHPPGNSGYAQYYNVQMDGFTKVLTAKTAVMCGATYQIKIAIGDASDGVWDSWVFLEANSFVSNTVNISYTAPNITPSGTGIYEGCETAYINFTRPQSDSGTEKNYALSFSGTAINGVDVEQIPDTLTFPAGQSEVSIPLVAIADGILEGNENFIITVEDLGCNAGDPVSIEIIISDLPQLQVSMPPVTINCGQQAVMEPEITGGIGNYSVTWEAGGLVQPSLSTYPEGPTSYPFVVTDTCGVTPYNGSAQVLFVVNPPLVVDVGPDISAQCLDEIVVTPEVTGGFGNYSYAWTANGAPISSSEVLSFYQNTNQSVQLTVTDICNVSASDQFNLVYPAVPILIEIGENIVATCIDQNTVTSEVSGGVGNYTYTWTLANQPAGTGPTVNVQTPVTALLKLVVDDQCGNSATDQLSVIIPPVHISLDIGPDVVATCLDNIPNSAITLENGIGNYSYVWTNNGENVSTAPQYSVQTGQNRVIGLTVTDQCGNTASDQKLISIPPVPVALSVFPAIDTMICLGTWATLGALAHGGVGDLTYTWTGITHSPTNTQNSSIVKESPPENTVYSVTVNDQCGNTNSRQTRVSVRELFPSFDAGYVSDNEVWFKNTTEGNDAFQWTFGNGATSTDMSEVVNFLGAPAWTGTLTVFSPEGCKKSVTREFTALGDLFVPNTFTPDNDGVNDVFFVVGHDLRYFELTIFNRYGEVVFKSYDIDEPWDGSYQGGGHFVPNGVYTYQLIAVGKRENTIERSGRILLFR